MSRVKNVPFRIVQTIQNKVDKEEVFTANDILNELRDQSVLVGSEDFQNLKSVLDMINACMRFHCKPWNGVYVAVYEKVGLFGSTEFVYRPESNTTPYMAIKDKLVFKPLPKTGDVRIPLEGCLSHLKVAEGAVVYLRSSWSAKTGANTLEVTVENPAVYLTSTADVFVYRVGKDGITVSSKVLGASGIGVGVPIRVKQSIGGGLILEKA